MHLDLNRILKEYTRGQLVLLADASKILHDPENVEEKIGEESPRTRKRSNTVERYIQTADTRKMTLTEYKKFLALQQEQGERS